MSMGLMRAAMAAVLGLALAAGSLGPAMAAGAEPAAAAETADRQVVVDAWDALNASGYPGLAPHVGKLKVVFGRAPEAAGTSAEAAETYGTAALMLTMEANEGHRFQEALVYGAKGLALMPDSTMLLTEMATAYNQQRRFGDSLALLDGWLAWHGAAEPGERARIHRARGFALIELQRLDEAEAAYRESLKLEPDHRGAQDELTYIAQLRQGGPRQDIGMTTAGKSATEGSKAVEPTEPVDD